MLKIVDNNKTFKSSLPTFSSSSNWIFTLESCFPSFDKIKLEFDLLCFQIFYINIKVGKIISMLKYKWSYTISHNIYIAKTEPFRVWRVMFCLDVSTFCNRQKPADALSFCNIICLTWESWGDTEKERKKVWRVQRTDNLQSFGKQNLNRMGSVNNKIIKRFVRWIYILSLSHPPRL